eukprot:TRINITY_DN12036_c0_g1_i1.p1 TRINITY_DN12036_c0_g1~~TRINITY_DN12036_c0_g1_i1.p1  ORF type:complete len:216 (-),score=27.11 TRINITY_DN12036_c0_g1_i1:39-686(-)
MSQLSEEFLFKVLVVGETGTGKTCVIKRFVHNVFSPFNSSTIGLDFALKLLRFDDQTSVQLQLWDIAGQERFSNMTRVYYKEADAAFVAYDVTSSDSFEAAITKWKTDIDCKVTLPSGEPIPVVLLANKCDLKPKGIDKSASEIKEFCEKNGFIGWFETSAKDNYGIESACKTLVQHVMQNKSPKKTQSRAPGEIKVDNYEEEMDMRTKKSGCCN